MSSESCKACGGSGWLHAERKDGWHTVEACATCCLYPDDKAAFNAHENTCACPWWKATKDSCQLWGQEFFQAAYHLISSAEPVGFGKVVVKEQAYNEIAKILAYAVTNKGRRFNEWRFKLDETIAEDEFLDEKGNIVPAETVEDILN